ncbi:MAG: RNase P subunit p30 family protein [Candidatus Bathyarchaeota archaeon]|nr:RNase P subunit p30 family protein [Candidatus Bathyarchaeota archaeon]
MRHYVDLHLRPSTPEQAQEMTNLAIELGYRHVALTKQANGIDGRITVATRVDIEARRSGELLDALKRSRRRFTIISVKCLSKEVARMAARDDRVDLLQFPDDPAQRKQNWLDHHEAALTEGTGRAYEINASDLIATSPTRLAKAINMIKRDLAVATRHDIPVVLSSGAATPLAMREPRALTALASLLDIDEEYASDMISTIPEAILERNRDKLGEGP